MICSIIASALIIITIALLMGLTPEQVTDDLISLITPKDSLRDEARAIRGNKKKHGIYASLMKMKAALARYGQIQTILACLLSVAGTLCGRRHPLRPYKESVSDAGTVGGVCSASVLLYRQYAFLL